MHLARRLRRAFAATMVLVAGPAMGGGPPGSPGEFDLPAGTRTFKAPIQMRYGASKGYTYIFRADIDAGREGVLGNLASVTFGGPDLKTVYLGSLFAERLATFRSPIAGARPPHWEY